MPHLGSYALGRRRVIPQGFPLRTVGRAWMLELIEGQVGRSAFHRPIPPSAYHTGDAFIARDVDRVIPRVELRIDLGRHVHPTNL